MKNDPGAGKLYSVEIVIIGFRSTMFHIYLFSISSYLVQNKSQSLPVPPGKMKHFHCAFFNFSAEGANQTGGWSNSGVETDAIYVTHVRCIASHLTSFVVLVSIVPSVGDPVSSDDVLCICVLL